ncbi:MAG: hypothetical protein OEV55_05475 [candidate division Zixibacteria bacterium]|nr:hypothetical protein [candidate division Zixibacteria bacterium]
MKKLNLVFSVLAILIIGSDVVKAENTITFSHSNENIVQAMELSVKNNSFDYLYAQGISSGDTLFKLRDRSKPANLKSPTTAFVIALVPGSVVHGAGHFYAGKPGRGMFLFGMELLGAGLLYWGALSSSLGEQSENDSSNDGKLHEFFGVTLFVGSWVADMIGAPKVVKNHNELVS